MGPPPLAEKAAVWQRRTDCRFWLATQRPQRQRLWPKNHREQPDLVHDAGRVDELHRERGKINLRLLASRVSAPPFELRLPCRAQLAKKVLHHRMAAIVAQIPDLAQKARSAESEESLHPLL